MYFPGPHQAHEGVIECPWPLPGPLMHAAAALGQKANLKPARGTVLGRLRARSASPGMEVPYPVMSEREMFLLDTQGYLRSVH